MFSLQAVWSAVLFLFSFSVTPSLTREDTVSEEGDWRLEGRALPLKASARSLRNHWDSLALCRTHPIPRLDAAARSARRWQSKGRGHLLGNKREQDGRQKWLFSMDQIWPSQERASLPMRRVWRDNGRPEMRHCLRSRVLWPETTAGFSRKLPTCCTIIKVNLRHFPIPRGCWHRFTSAPFPSSPAPGLRTEQPVGREEITRGRRPLSLLPFLTAEFQGGADPSRVIGSEVLSLNEFGVLLLY